MARVQGHALNPRAAALSGRTCYQFVLIDSDHMKHIVLNEQGVLFEFTELRFQVTVELLTVVDCDWLTGLAT